MTSRHTIHVDSRRDIDDVSIRARVDRLTENGPFAAVHLTVDDDELVLIVTRPTNALAVARVLSRAVYELSEWATDQPVPDPDPVSSAPEPDPKPGRVLAYNRGGVVS